MAGRGRRRRGRYGRVEECAGIRQCECPTLYCRGVHQLVWDSERMIKEIYAEKSADAVAASVASEERRACQHAPLWPMNVPIQSPVTPSRSIGLLSLQADMR